MMRKLFVLLVLSALMQFGITAVAQEKFAWNELSQEERQILQQLEDQWDDLPAERQHQLRRGASRWLTMRPEERQSAQTIQRRFQNLSPQQQQQINQRFQRFNQLERARQQQLRTLQQRFRNLPEEERARLREQFENQARERNERMRDGTTQPRQTLPVRPRAERQARPAPPEVRQSRPTLRSQDSTGVRPPPARPNTTPQRPANR